MAKRRGLGRGLDALLGSSPGAALELGEAEEGMLRNLPLDLVRRGRHQPRTELDPEALEELARSIRAQGVVQPIVVRPAGDGAHFEIIAGERRWRAAQAAGLSDIPAVVREVSDKAALAIALIENIQREDLNPIEEANALSRLVEEFGMTHEAVANAVGRSRAAVSNLLRLLELNPDVRALVEQGQLEMGHARALLALSGEPQSRTAQTVAARGLSARETERLVRRLRSAPSGRKTSARREDPDVRRLQEDLAQRLGAPVRIQHGRRGEGRVIIHYGSLDELDGILTRIR